VKSGSCDGAKMLEVFDITFQLVSIFSGGSCFDSVLEILDPSNRRMGLESRYGLLYDDIAMLSSNQTRVASQLGVVNGFVESKDLAK
jgi:hypothetical protein